MRKRYSMDEVAEILLEKGVVTESRGKRTKNSDIERPERKIKGIAGINIPPRALHYQIRATDALYEIVKNDTRLHIDDSVRFPLEDFIDEAGRIVKYQDMSDTMRRHFDAAYGRVETMKSGNHFKDRIDWLTESRTVYCIDHGAVERSSIRNGKTHLIVLFTAEDMDVVIDDIVKCALRTLTYPK